MQRIVSVVAVGASLAAAIGLYGFKHEAQMRRAHIDALGASIAAERDRIAVLEAEWSALNDPGRIQSLADRFLSLQPLDTRQTGSLAEIPIRPAPEPDPAETMTIEELLAGLEDLTTGSVR